MAVDNTTDENKALPTEQAPAVTDDTTAAQPVGIVGSSTISSDTKGKTEEELDAEIKAHLQQTVYFKLPSGLKGTAELSNKKDYYLITFKNGTATRPDTVTTYTVKGFLHFMNTKIWTQVKK